MAKKIKRGKTMAASKIKHRKARRRNKPAQMPIALSAEESEALMMGLDGNGGFTEDYLNEMWFQTMMNR